MNIELRNAKLGRHTAWDIILKSNVFVATRNDVTDVSFLNAMVESKFETRSL